MILWIDDIRRPPNDKNYFWVKSTNQAIAALKTCIFEHIDIDHDAGIYVKDGGDYIKVLDWLEMNNISYNIHIHSMNPVGRMNMRRIINKNNWKELV